MPSSNRTKPNPSNTEWLSSPEACRFLKISSCTLAHLRLDGHLIFERRRNAYFYRGEDCRQVLLSNGLKRGNLRKTPKNKGDEWKDTGKPQKALSTDIPKPIQQTSKTGFDTSKSIR